MVTHPSTLTALARQRQAEHQAEADRYRLALHAMDGGTARRDRGVLAALAAILPLAALLLG